MATTQDILAMGCDALGLKGANRYDSYQVMRETWVDKGETVPTEAAVTAAGQAALSAVTSEKSSDDTERSNAQTALATLATIRDRSSWTVAALGAAIQAIARLLIWIIKRELKR